jgi:hypothetical protein
MNRIARIAAAAAFGVAWPTAILCGPAGAQTFPWQGLSNPNVLVDYVEPREPYDAQDKDYAKDMATYQRMMKTYERMKRRQVLEEFSAFLSPLRLPKTLRVKTVQCNVLNAYYDPTERTIKICYEWMDETETRAPQKVSPEGITRQEAIVGGFVGVLLHEAGHAVNDLLNLPVLGREEDSADQIAGFIMLQFGKDVARIAIKGTAYSWLTFARQDRPVYWDTHSTPAQRFYNFLCIGYGGDPQTFKDLADKWLSKGRAETCEHEYKQVRNAFNKTIMPHIDPVLMKKVQTIQWIQPDDGRWE